MAVLFYESVLVCLICCLNPQTTAMVMFWQSINLFTLFLGRHFTEAARHERKYLLKDRQLDNCNACSMKWFQGYFLPFKPGVLKLENNKFSYFSTKICCGYSKEPSQSDGSFEHPKYTFKLMEKKLFTIFSLKICVYLDIRSCMYTYSFLFTICSRQI